MEVQGKPLTIGLNCSRMTDEAGGDLGFVLVFEDLTELIKAQKVAAWREVAQRIAHEIKNPLTPIQLATERLRKKREEGSPDFDRVFEESTRMIINEVDGLAALVNGFSSFARLPAPHLIRQPIGPILEEVVLLYQSSHKEIVFQGRFDQNAPLLRLDRDQIKRVLINLFENAVEAMRTVPPGGTIRLTTQYNASERSVEVRMEDEGRGVAPDDFDNIFLPAFSRKKGGTGLGLAIVHRIVLDHGGHISAAPRQPGGTVFTIVLPVAT